MKKECNKEEEKEEKEKKFKSTYEEHFKNPKDHYSNKNCTKNIPIVGKDYFNQKNISGIN
jgi:hypothetical protein